MSNKFDLYMMYIIWQKNSHKKLLLSYLFDFFLCNKTIFNFILWLFFISYSIWLSMIKIATVAMKQSWFQNFYPNFWFSHAILLVLKLKCLYSMTGFRTWSTLWSAENSKNWWFRHDIHGSIKFLWRPPFILNESMGKIHLKNIN